MTAWHDEDEFWALMGPGMWTAERLAAADGEVEWIVRTLGLAPGAAVLDLPCGVGRHAHALARRGFRVTAVDRTRAYLDRARAGEPAGAGIEWIEGDMREFDGDARFDAAINLYTSFGYFDDHTDNLRAARSLRRALRPGGRLVLDVSSKECVARRYREKWWTQLPDGSIHFEQAVPIENWRRMENRWAVVDPDGRRRERVTRLWLYSAVELDALLREAGFREIRCSDGLTDRPYDAHATRLGVIATA
jgi:SAM-dependent methyltransferase